MGKVLILGIETSCDETSVSIVANGHEILSNIIASSLKFHKRYGGVVPEIACRHHTECINVVLDNALKKAKVSLNDIDAVAVTSGPGLVGALLVGVSAAKAISYSLKIPLIAVSHLKAHIYSAAMNGEKITFPAAGLVVSGGHTSLVLIKDFLSMELLGQTRDDAVGESFDKVAKILGLGFPGGPIIEKAARSAGQANIRFPKARLKGNDLDFSFSGIKTAVLYYTQELKAKNNRIPIADICACFQRTVIDMVVENTIKCCLKNGLSNILVGGGVSANSVLRQRLSDKAQENRIKVMFPAPGLYTDNAAMVAGLSYHLYRKGVFSDYSLTAQPDLSF